MVSHRLYIQELESLDLRELKRKYNTTGMKAIFLKIKEFIDEAREDGYMLPEWDLQMK